MGFRFVKDCPIDISWLQCSFEAHYVVKFFMKSPLIFIPLAFHEQVYLLEIEIFVRWNKGAFTNYVYKILPNIDNLPTPCWRLQRNSFTKMLGKSAFGWHFKCHLPTLSYQRSLWTPPDFNFGHQKAIGLNIKYNTLHGRNPDIFLGKHIIVLDNWISWKFR